MFILDLCIVQLCKQCIIICYHSKFSCRSWNMLAHLHVDWCAVTCAEEYWGSNSPLRSWFLHSKTTGIHTGSRLLSSSQPSSSSSSPSLASSWEFLLCSLGFLSLYISFFKFLFQFLLPFLESLAFQCSWFDPLMSCLSFAVHSTSYLAKLNLRFQRCAWSRGWTFTTHF